MNIKIHFERFPVKKIRRALLHNSYIQHIDISKEYSNLYNALWYSFDWESSPEGFEFWFDVYDRS
jgi:hypothetical protein